MKRMLFPLAVLMFIALTSCQQASLMSRIEIEDFRNENGEYVFRDSRWGMTKPEVEQALGMQIGGEISNNSQGMSYVDKIDAVIFGRSEKDCSLTYVFVDDVLFSLGYNFYGEIGDVRLFYDEVVEKSTGAFGEPQEAYALENGETVRWIKAKEGGERYIFSLTFMNSAMNTDKAFFGALCGALTPQE